MPVTLLASLGLDDSDFQRNLARSVKNCGEAAKSIQGRLEKVAGALGVSLSVGGVVAAGRAVLDFASNIQDSSDAIGISTDKFQQYTFAVEQSGGTQEAFVKGMASLIQKIEEAKSGNAAAIASFQKLGISLTDIKTSSPDQLLLKISDALHDSGGAGESFAATCDVLGSKVAIKLIPALKAGSEEFQALAKSAKIASSDTVSALDEVGDKMARLSRRILTAEAEGASGLLRLLNNNEGAGFGASTGPATAGDLDTARYNALAGYGRSVSAPSLPDSSNPASRNGAYSGPSDAERRAAADNLYKRYADADQAARDAQKHRLDAEEEGIKAADRIIALWSEAKAIKLESDRDGMDADHLRISLIEERNKLLMEASKLEQSITAEQRDQGAQKQVQAAQITRRLATLDREHPHEWQGDLDPREHRANQKFAAFANFTTLGFGASVQGSGSLTGSGPLISSLDRSKSGSSKNPAHESNDHLRVIRRTLETAFKPEPA